MANTDFFSFQPLVLAVIRGMLMSTTSVKPVNMISTGSRTSTNSTLSPWACFMSWASRDVR